VIAKQHSPYQNGPYANTGGRPVSRRLRTTSVAVSQTRRQGAGTTVQH
jgi:hypothetical protein